MPGKPWMGYTAAAREDILAAAHVVYGSAAWDRLLVAMDWLEACAHNDERARAKETADAA